MSIRGDLYSDGVRPVGRSVRGRPGAGVDGTIVSVRDDGEVVLVEVVVSENYTDLFLVDTRYLEWA